MRAAFVNAVCGSGSTGKIVTGLLRSLRGAGDDGRVFFGIGKAQDIALEDTCRFGSTADYYLHNAVSRLTDHAGFYSTAATRRMIKAIEAYQPDLIHLHNLHGYYLNVEELFHFLSGCGKPVLWTLHDCWAFTGHCTHFSAAGCEQWKTGCRSCSQLSRYPKCLLRGDVERNYARKRSLFTSVPGLTLITPSVWLAGIVRQSFLGKLEIIPIPNGIDTERFCPVKSDVKERLGLTGKKMALGVASVWNERKGLQDLLRLSELLPDDWRLVLVGLTKQQQALFPKLVVTMERTSSQEALARLYSAADVFINPSYEETMGMTTAEALACGTPAVVYDRTAVPELVDESCGAIVPAGDVKALCAAITSISLDRKAARARGLRYAQSKQNEAHLRLYRRLVQASKNGLEAPL